MQYFHETIIRVPVFLTVIPIAQQIAPTHNIEFIPGIEISARHGAYDLHLLGYFIDSQNDKLKSYVKIFQDERKKRAQQIVARLKKMGMNIAFEFVLQKAQNGSIGRPHIAEVMLEQGYVFSFHEAFLKI